MLKLIACGRGRVVQTVEVLREIEKLTRRSLAELKILYLGTAAFESAEAYDVQTRGFVAAGSNATALLLTRACHTPPEEERT